MSVTKSEALIFADFLFQKEFHQEKRDHSREIDIILKQINIENKKTGDKLFSRVVGVFLLLP